MKKSRFTETQIVSILRTPDNKKEFFQLFKKKKL